MAKQDRNDEEFHLRVEEKASEPTVTVTMSALEALINSSIDARVRDRLAEVQSKSFDEGMQERMDRMRGKDRPLPPEELVPCVSPITGATFTVRLIMSRAYPQGRVVELLDYVRPEGWDKHKDDGGLYNDVRENMVPLVPGQTLNKGQYKYRDWCYRAFWMTDWRALSSKPGSFLAQWRAPVAVAAE